jgi:phospholipase/carboxylesterase
MLQTYAASESEELIVLQPQQTPATAAVIWLHGLGADGYDFVPIVSELHLPATLGVRFIFPHARERPVTINNGYVMRAWYDIRGLGGSAGEDDAGIRESEGLVRRLITAENEAGIASDRIVIAGFSQGGAIALQTVLRYPEALAGLLALSTYLPLAKSVAAEASAQNRNVPILMCHGLQDGVVPLMRAEESRALLTQLGYAVLWKTYPMPHSVVPQEIQDIAAWLLARLQAG